MDKSANHRKIVLVVDDIGMPFSQYTTGFAIPMDAYYLLLELAHEFNLIIPVAAVAAFLDVDNISGKVEVNKDAGRIIDFLRTNSEILPVWNHGLTHRYGGRLTEFLLYTSDGSVPRNIQYDHLAVSQEIIKKAGLGCPTILVPPGHAWEPDVTDAIALELGFEGIAIVEGIKTPFKQWIRHPNKPFQKTWPPSKHLDSLFRQGLGISVSKHTFEMKDYLKMRQYVLPSNRIIKLLVRRTRGSSVLYDHFYAHIQNFADIKSLKIWRRILRDLLKWESRKHIQQHS
jgi:hypothetical protein